VAAAEITDNFSGSSVVVALETAINNSMESSQKGRFLIGQLFVDLVKKHKFMSCNEIAAAVEAFVSYADDILVDVPKLWSYLSEILAKPCLELPAADGKQLIACALKGRMKKKESEDFITGLMASAAVATSESGASQLWNSLGLSWSDYTDADPTELLKKQKLEFLLISNESQKSPVSNSDNLTDCMTMLDKLLQSDPSSDAVLNLIRSNYNEELTPKIASAFAMTIIRSCLTNNDTDATRYDVNTTKLETLAEAFTSLVTGRMDFELQTLHALQDLMEELTHPEKLSGKILERLVVDGLLTDVTVLDWWKNDDSYEKGKAMTICQASQVLKWMEEDVPSDPEAPLENRK